MSKAENLIWSDIKSKTMGIEKYLEKIKDKALPQKSYKVYVPKQEIIARIKEKLSQIREHLRILVIGADWCPDCYINVPRMIKVLEAIGKNTIDFQILYGVMVNALRKPGDITWHKKNSPPEATEPKFNLEKIPTFYFFVEEKLIGRIVERPTKFPSLEEELLNILEEHLQ